MPWAVSILLVVAGAVVLVAAGQAWRRVGGREVFGVRTLAVIGLALAGVAYVLHAAGRGSAVPLTDNLDALTLLGGGLVGAGLLVGGTVKRAGWVEAGLLPVAGVTLIGAAVAWAFWPHVYAEGDVVLAVHRLATFAGAAASAVAAAAGGAYLVVSRRLREHQPPAVGLGSLVRLERAAYVAAGLGFGLLTLGLLSGLGRLGVLLGGSAGGVKMSFVVAALVAQGLVLSSGLWPRLRGRATAVLSVAGFVAIVGVVVAVQLT